MINMCVCVCENNKYVPPLVTSRSQRFPSTCVACHIHGDDISMSRRIFLSLYAICLITITTTTTTTTSTTATTTTTNYYYCYYYYYYYQPGGPSSWPGGGALRQASAL